MSNNEAPQALEPTGEIDRQTAAMPTTEAECYTYQRADGTVERAASAEDAFARCPVLGRLAIEAPEQADILLELAAAGREKMREAGKEAQRSKLQEQEAERRNKPQAEKQRDKPDLVLQARPEAVKCTIETEQNTAAHVVAMRREQAERIAKLPPEEIIKKESDTIKKPAVIEPKPYTPKVVKKERAERAEHIAAKKAENADAVRKLRAQLEVAALSRADMKSVATIDTAEVKPVEQAKVTVVAPKNETEAKQKIVNEPENVHAISPAKAISESVHAEAPKVAETATIVPETATFDTEPEIAEVEENSIEQAGIDIAAVAEVLDTNMEAFVDNAGVELLVESTEAVLPTEAFLVVYPAESAVLEEVETFPSMGDEERAVVDTGREVELSYKPETLEAYGEVLAVAAEYESEQESASESVETGEMVDTAVLGTETDIIKPVAKVETPVPSTIDTQAFDVFVARQPKIEVPVTLETIRQQAVNELPLEQTFVQLAGVLPEAESLPEQEKIRVILQEITAALPARNEARLEKPQTRITPEITEKVLILLRNLGYEQPREVLVDFVKQYGLSFLLQALQAMCELSSESERKEFLATSVASSSDEADDARTRVGKVIFGLISTLNMDAAAESSVKLAT